MHMSLFPKKDGYCNVQATGEPSSLRTYKADLVNVGKNVPCKK